MKRLACDLAGPWTEHLSHWGVARNYRPKDAVNPGTFFIIIEKLGMLTHVVGNLSHKGIAQRVLPAYGVKDAAGE